MSTRKSLILPAAVLLLASLAESSAFGADAKETLLHIFNPRTAGQFPQSGVIFDPSGNLFGTTILGGSACPSGGTVFELIPGSDGNWIEKTLHSFPCGLQDGSGPLAGLIFDRDGNLYGTTVSGGGSCNLSQLGCGTVFQLSPKGDGHWAEKVLHRFGQGSDGVDPEAGLILDPSGNLYGVTRYGGRTSCYQGCGIVFELRRGENGRWNEKILHYFNSDGRDGIWPRAGLTIDGDGKLYGTTISGGRYCANYGCGTVFELRSASHGKWIERVIHSFDGKDGNYPQAKLVSDSYGNLYGTTAYGGSSQCGSESETGCGTVFELTPQTDGQWHERVLRAFFRTRESPYSGDGGLILDVQGNLYGTTWIGGLYWDGDVDCIEPCGGTAFKLSPGPNGEWTQTTLHSFGHKSDHLQDGNDPVGRLVFDNAGNLYGTTELGGDYCAGGIGCGSVFELAP
jgi:uncharacterized repeat protein (TIGR03803 family)